MSSRTARAQLSLALLAGVVVLGGLGGVAEAHTRHCGDVITADEELHNDIGPCHGDGLVVRGSNITVNLNGHTIFGEGGLVVEHQAAGVRILGQRNVTVTNGTVRDFYHGVRVTQGSGNRVTGIRAVRNQGGNGVVLENSSDNVVADNLVVSNGRFSGVSTFDSVSLPAGAARNTIRNNVVHTNAFMGAHGISLEHGSGHVVTGNKIVASGRDGISLFGPVSDAMVTGNTVQSNGRHGINVQSGSARNLIQGNQVTRNAQIGILVAGQGNRIVDNLARNNRGTDLRDTSPGDTCGANTWSGNRFGTAVPACAGA
ncbi:MAG TPA: right-handed parallel beta-helix repeat-containing protein [Acidimicrobiales bacterium]|nr:right-handed parallel beta-helix repeat-containing protein [Acidimicrobiales bacterium]